MKNASVPEIDRKNLRDHASSERVERVWERLETEIGTVAPRPRAALWWAPAALVIVFGSGVFVGARWFRPEAVPAASVAAEPAGAVEPPVLRESPAPVVPESEREPRKRRPTIAPPAPAPLELEPAPVEEPLLVSPVVPGPLSVAAPPDWQRLADEGEFQAARVALDRQGGFDAALSAASSAEQLRALADIARGTGQRVRAVRALRLFLQKYPAHPLAPELALSLANILDKDGDRAGAAEAFAIYRRLSPTGEFAEDALARQVDVAVERGDIELATRLAEQYAKDFPNGRRLGEIKKQLAKLTGQKAASPGASTENGQGEADEQPSEEAADDDTSGAARPAP
jgi:hypothetical protein